MRLLCLFFPRLALQTVLRDRPRLQDRPVVLLRGHGDEALVSAVSSAASGRYVLPGMTAGQAHQRCPGAIFLPDNAGECLDLLERVASVLRVRATPMVEIGGPDHLFLDLKGLFGEEPLIAANLAALVRIWTGFEVRAGVAATRLAALEAARPARGLPAVLPPGGQAAEAPEAQLESFEARELSGSVGLPDNCSELVFRAALADLFGRLQLLLEGRGESFRTICLDIETADGARSLTRRVVQALHRGADALDLLSQLPDFAAHSSPCRIRVTLGRLGPDMRVRPCAAPRRAFRSERLPLRAAG